MLRFRRSAGDSMSLTTTARMGLDERRCRRAGGSGNDTWRDNPS